MEAELVDSAFFVHSYEIVLQIKISAFLLLFQKKPASLQCVTFDTGEIVRQL